MVVEFCDEVGRRERVRVRGREEESERERGTLSGTSISRLVSASMISIAEGVFTAFSIYLARVFHKII